MRIAFRTLTLGLAVAIASALMPACNTVKGAGKDIQKGGQAVERAAVKTGQKMKR